jgi:acyl carrier protein
MDPDGCVVLLGRKDLQHKILGRHIDIPAVETALLRVPGVRQAAARTIEDEKTGAFLCGYVVADPSLDLSAVRSAVRETLPDWMVPSQIIALPDLPLDANGKIKRASLPRPSRPANRMSVNRRPPTPIEAAVAGLWEAVLERPGIDLEDDFFALGGSSLTAMRLVSGVESALGIAVPVNAVFQDLKTITAMAAYIQAARARQKT